MMSPVRGSLREVATWLWLLIGCAIAGCAYLVIASFAAIGSTNDGFGTLFSFSHNDHPGVVAAAVVVLLLYFVPTVIGSRRKVRNLGSLIVVNVFLGWTFLGWVIALAMSMRTVDKR